MDIDLSCDVDECKTTAYSSIWCEAHRSLNRNYGTPTPIVICYSCGTSFVLKVSNRARNGWHTCDSCRETIEKYSHLMSKSGVNRQHRITKSNYLKMLIEQNFRCGLCKMEFDRVLQIDHDHSCCDTGSSTSCGKCIRGLLCGSCNTLVGLMERAVLKGLLTSFTGPVREYLDRGIRSFAA